MQSGPTDVSLYYYDQISQSYSYTCLIQHVPIFYSNTGWGNYCPINSHSLIKIMIKIENSKENVIKNTFKVFQKKAYHDHK